MSALTNAGHGVVCPCCDKHVRKFARFHGVNDQCPGCGSLMRQRAVLLYLRDVLQAPRRGDDVLLVGPGPSLVRWFRMLEGIRYVALDLDSPLATVRGDVRDMPFADDSFDLIVCLHVLEHVDDDRAAIRELFRVLAPGAKAVIQVPPSDFEHTLEDPRLTTPEERERVFGQWDHVRICGADYGDRIAEAGFDVAELDYVEQLASAERDRYGLRTGEPFYVCIKD